MSKYQITLTPIDKFFFGGDMTFKVEKEDTPFNERYSSYIIQSSMFPQQTSLLGMLRFLILRNSGESIFSNGMIVDKSEAKKRIGSRSFMVNANHDKNSFGKIKSLSHVKIRRKENDKTMDLEFAPLFKEINFNKKIQGYYYPKEVFTPYLSKDDFDAKKGLNTRLTDGELFFGLDEVFKEDRRIGINRDINTGKTDDNALFIQVSYRFNNEKAQHCFVMDVEVDDDLNLASYNGQMVSIGGDNSQFIIGITDEVNAFNKIHSLANAVYMLSPTFLSKEDAQQAKFAITTLMPFRFLTSEMDKVDSYHILSKQLSRSDKYELYAPGSVFYFENEVQKKEFIEIIESKKDFRQIGYNEYK